MHFRIASWAVAAIVGLALMGFVQTGIPSIPGNDGYYHVKMAALLPELGLTKSFPWLRWTILHENFVSHHYGFHALLLPFVRAAEFFGAERSLGGKMASCVAIAAALVIFERVIRSRGAPFPLLWVLFVAALPWHFWLRMSFVRAPMAALPLLLLAVHWSAKQRVIPLLFLAFVFTQVYGGAVLFPIVPGAFLLAAIISREGRRLAVQELGASLLGVALGMVISPYFPANISFYATQLFDTGLGAARDVGGEWKPYETWTLLVQAAPLAVVWFACLALRLRTAVRASTEELGMLFVNLAFFVLTLKSRRFVEYWPLFALVSAADFAAVAWRARQAVWPVRIPNWLRVSTLIVIGYLAVWNLWRVRSELEPSYDVALLRDAMSFLQQNSPPQSLVFTDDWDIFPMCFYFNHHNTYAVGLDPEFTRKRYPGLWERYRKITRAELPARVSRKNLGENESAGIEYEDIGTIFGARYVLVMADHPDFYDALIKRRDHFVLIYPPPDRLSRGQPQVAIFEFVP